MTRARGTRTTASPEETEEAAAESGVPIPQFLPPTPPPPRRQDSPEEVTFHPAESPEEVRGSHPEEDADSADDDPVQMAVGSSPESTGKSLLKPLVTAQQIAAGRAIMTAVLKSATTLVNRRTRATEEDGRWLMTKDELRDVGTPFARILARRTPLPSGEQASDMADMVEGFVGLIAYAMRQMDERPAPPAPAQRQDEPAAPAGPGATSNPLDPAYTVR